MALVAYASSDDSDISDDENESEKIKLEPVETSKTDKKEEREFSKPSQIENKVFSGKEDVDAGPSNGCNSKSSSPPIDNEKDLNVNPVDLIEDDEYDALSTPIAQVNSTSDVGSSGLKLPAPKSQSQEQSFGLVAVEKTDKSLSAPLSGPNLDEDVIKLPQDVENKKGSLLDSMVFDDELEEEVRPKTYGAELPEAKPTKAKGRVKITIPSLPQDSDSDEEDAPKKKKSKTTGMIGLFSLLPEPKNLSVKEVGRQLVPHTLTRRPPPAKPPPKPVAKPAAKPTSALPGVPALPSDDEEEEEEESSSGSFFSITSAPAVNSTPSVAAQKPSRSSSTAADTNIEPALRGPWKGPAHISEAFLSMFPDTKAKQSDKTSPVPAKAHTPSESVPSATQVGANNAPLVFNDTSSGGDGSYNYSAPEEYGGYEQQMYTETPEVEGDQYLQDQEFLKIQGSRSRKEEINIIDVNADAMLDPSNLVKNLTEETMTSHSRKRKDLPSGQQKRKHQITYLAHQAKERELELKNAWANNRQTRKQTQSKYGF